MKIEDLNDDAVRRIASRTRDLMMQRYGREFEAWTQRHEDKIRALTQCTWLSICEELKKEKN